MVRHFHSDVRHTLGLCPGGFPGHSPDSVPVTLHDRRNGLARNPVGNPGGGAGAAWS
ncbi:hypothetical protein GCM10027088_62500 [Nocardia goodfellowii]